MTNFVQTWEPLLWFQKEIKELGDVGVEEEDV